MAHVELAIHKIGDVSNAYLTKLIWRFFYDVGDTTFTASD